MELQTWFLLILSIIPIMIVIVFVKLLQSVYTGGRTTLSNSSMSGIVRHPPTGSITFDSIVNEFLNLKEISCAMHKAGLEKSQMILGIDFTASNEWQGRRTFSQKSLHAISEKVDERYGRRGSLHHVAFYRDNPYQKVISILGQTLEPFDEDRLIPAYGFGDSVTKDTDVFPLSGI